MSTFSISPTRLITRRVGPVEYTEEEQERCIEWFRTLCLRELRKRQDLCHQQMERAYQQKNTVSLDSLEIIRKMLAEAVNRKCFGGKK